MKRFSPLLPIYILSTVFPFTLPRSATAQSEPPAVDGNISSLSSPADFFVDGKHVITNPKTIFSKPALSDGQIAFVSDPAIAKTLAVGDHVQVFGNNDRHLHAIIASSVALQPLTHDRITGFAVIQKVIATSPQLLLEADGYRIGVPLSALHNKPPLPDQTISLVNMWINYSGRWNSDGQIVAEHAEFSPFSFNPHLQKGLEKSKATIVAPVYPSKPGEPGRDGQITAPYLYAKNHTASIPANPELQHRIQTIGERLVPPSQKALHGNDSQKIHFQFYAVDGLAFPTALGSPDGIVLLPVKAINALQNDDQVAAILSPGVAQALEWQVPPAAIGAAGPTMIALGEMPAIGPLAGIALISGGLYEMKHNTYPVRFDPWQRIRVGLSLLCDAGYDIHQAPVAWQILRYGDTHVANKSPSEQSAYLLNIIGLEYAHDDHPSTQSPADAAQ